MIEGTTHEVADIRSFLLSNLDRRDLVDIAAGQLHITRRAVLQELGALARAGFIEASGTSRNRTFSLITRELLNETYEITLKLQEDVVWSHDVGPKLRKLPPNVVALWNYCFTEIFNNAIDHSEGTEIFVYVQADALNTELTIHDNGVGIFKKIQVAMELVDERQAVLELAKGKFTTDKSRHSGLGVFFSSRMLDSFDILSGTVYFSHEAGLEHDWALQAQDTTSGTTVFMRLGNASKRTTLDIFNRFSDGKANGFNKTVVPVALAQYDFDQLVSRSQAKRVLARVDLFSHVVFDFTDVLSIGQAFADEIFRVFANAHPTVRLSTINTTRDVEEMIRSVKKEAVRQSKAERRRIPIGDRRSRK